MKKLNRRQSCMSYTQPLAALELSNAQLRERLCITHLLFYKSSVDTIQDGSKGVRSRSSSRSGGILNSCDLLQLFLEFVGSPQRLCRNH